MKMSLRSLIIAGLVSLTAVCMQAAEVLSEAVVLKLSGPAEAVFPGKTAPVAIKVGDKLPQGTAITTSATSEVDLQVFPGTISTIKPNTKVEIEKLSLTSSEGVVTKQSSVINLKAGIVVSDLDPTKKSINDYSIRTPKGVAAARGTIYVVYVLADGSSITYVARGSVTFINPVTGQSVTITAGTAVKVDASGNIGTPSTSLGRTLSNEVRNGNHIEDTETTNTGEGVDPTIIVSPSKP